jgi:hypothetical protein
MERAVIQLAQDIAPACRYSKHVEELVFTKDLSRFTSGGCLLMGSRPFYSSSKVDAKTVSRIAILIFCLCPSLYQTETAIDAGLTWILLSIRQFSGFAMNHAAKVSHRKKMLGGQQGSGKSRHMVCGRAYSSALIVCPICAILRDSRIAGRFSGGDRTAAEGEGMAGNLLKWDSMGY